MANAPVNVAPTPALASATPLTQPPVLREQAGSGAGEAIHSIGQITIAGPVDDPTSQAGASIVPLRSGPTPDRPTPPDSHDPMPLAVASGSSSRASWAIGTASPSEGNAPPERSSASRVADNWSDMKISDTQLDEMRGGFDISSGLQIAFGIERAVFVNGQLVATTSFNIPNLAQITAPQAQQLAQALNTTTLVQNGPGNYAPASLPGTTAATIVQNTLNNQTIKALTTVNAAVNTLAQYKALNLQSTLNSAISNAVIPK